MYDLQKKCWVSREYDDQVVLWCENAAKAENADAMFVCADRYLAHGKRSDHTADALYYMEQAAKKDHPDAALAMGQMYQYGWTISRDLKKALQWYETAAKLGSKEAEAYLNEVKRKKLLRTILTSAAAALAAFLVGIVVLFPSWFGILPEGVRVHKETELILPETTADFARTLTELIGSYDTDLMISGQCSTNRLVLRFEGRGIDLSAFPADVVIADQGRQYVVLQFATEEEAQQCLEALKQMANVVFVETDHYDTSIEDQSGMTITASVPLYHSDNSGFDYYTWGATFLGLDVLSAWLMQQQCTPITVGVVDTGATYFQDFGNRLLPGIDLVDPTRSDAWFDKIGHGTHVCGTILDCTQGLDVSVYPVRVFQGSDTSSTLIAFGILCATDAGVDVINLSLGGGCDAFTEDVIRQALDQNIVVVAAAGNDGVDLDANAVCPAHIPGCITVSGCQSDIALYDWTNYGPSVDVCAPGVDVVSYHLNGMMASLTGTSMATPHISALAAMLVHHLPDRTPAQIEKYLKDYAFNPGDHLFYGEGIPVANFFAGQ